ncbi:hypothetical protein ACFQYP_23435 [Nonomuraea antimicrobica]
MIGSPPRTVAEATSSVPSADAGAEGDADAGVTYVNRTNIAIPSDLSQRIPASLTDTVQREPDG